MKRVLSLTVALSMLLVAVFSLSSCGKIKELLFYDDNAPTDLSEFEYTEVEGGIRITGYKNVSTTKVVIPEGVVEIGENAFFAHPYLHTVILSDGVKRIDSYAFKGCPRLISVTLGENVEYIGRAAFDEATELKSIVIPASVKEMGPNVFEDCDRLTIYCEAEGQPEGWNKAWNPEGRTVVFGYTE